MSEPTKLPEPPWRVYAIAPDEQEPRWWVWCSEVACWSSELIAYSYEPGEITVIPHPRNDPEGLELIRQAKERDQ